MKCKRNKVIEYISWLPVVIIVAFIFLFSSQEGDVSISKSKAVTQLITKTDDWSDYLENLHIVVREMAHFAEYALLALSVALAVTVNGIGRKLRLIYMFLIGIFIACLDEFYQVFVPDRYGDLIDLVTDSFGIMLSILIIIILEKIIQRIKKNKNNKIDTNFKSEDIRREFMGITIDNITFEEAIDKIINIAKKGKRKYILTPNVDHIVKIQKDEEFRKIYEEADLVVVDGTPVMWIAEAGGRPFKEKIPGADMLPEVCAKAAKAGLSLFFFGAAEGVAGMAADNMRKKYRNIKIRGVYSPPLGFEKDEVEISKAIDEINKAKADIVVFSLGSPKQEKFIYKYRDKMNFNIALPFGAAIDFAAGNVKRAPLWMRKIGLEWLFRFLQEPGRLFRRYFVDDMKIFYYAWKYRHDL